MKENVKGSITQTNGRGDNAPLNTLSQTSPTPTPTHSNASTLHANEHAAALDVCTELDGLLTRNETSTQCAMGKMGKGAGIPIAIDAELYALFDYLIL